MARPRLRWIAVTIAGVFAALAFLWAISVLWRQLSPLWDSRIVIAISVLIALAAMAFLVGIWWLWWRLPRRQVARLSIQISDPKDRADTEDNFRKTVGQALGGAAVLIGAGAAYLQFTQQQQATHDLLISNQVSKSFEQLGNTETATRLGGIYGLEGVMNAPGGQYQQQVLEALCAFVRDGTNGQNGQAPAGDNSPATDIQAALTVIGRRKEGPGRVNLGGVNIPHADLTDAILRGANLRGAILTGADLTGATLTDARLLGANLTGAILIGADLTGARLLGATLVITDLSGAILAGADLTGADLSDAKLDGQAQLDQACGTGAALPPGLTLRLCPAEPAARTAPAPPASRAH